MALRIGTTPTALVVAAFLVGCGAPATEAPSTKTAADVSVPASTGGEGGPQAPDFDLPTLDGSHVSLSSLRGKVVLIDFWSTICDPCLKEMPELVKLYQERKDKGFTVLAIATDGPETVANVSSVAKELKMVFPVLLDTETAALDRYNPEGRLPFTEVVDRNGNVVLKRSGYQPGDVESQRRLVEAIDKAMAQ